MAVDIRNLPAPPPSPPIEGVDFRADPYPFYRRLLDEAPVSEQTDYGYVMVARHADIVRLLRDRRLSSDDRNTDEHEDLVATGVLGAEYQALLDQRSFLRRDAPDHTRLRALVSGVFTRRAVERLRPAVQRMVDEAIDRAAGRGRMDLVEELAYPLPVTIISQLLGVPAEDHLRLRSWSRAQLCCSFEASGTLPGDQQQRNCMVQGDLTSYFDDLIARRVHEPGDDLLSALIAVRDEGDRLTLEEVNATARLLLVGGHETTVGLIANGTLALLRHPDQLALLRQRPALVASAVDEVLRYDPPFQFVTRMALEDVEVGGYRIARGRVIVLWLAAGNRDGDHFAEPDRFDVTRSERQHLAFGAGAHFCLGAPLARLQSEIALGTLARRLSEPELEKDPPDYTDAVHAIAELPIRFQGVQSA